MIKKSFFISLTFLLLQTCQPTSPTPTTPKINPQDSIAIVQQLAMAATQPALADSLLLGSKNRLKNDQNLLPLFQFNLASYFYRTGQFEVADSIALTHIQSTTDSTYFGVFYNMLGNIRILKAQQEEGIAYYQKAIAKFEQKDEKARVAAIKINIANLFFSRLDTDNAYKYSQEAEGLLEELNDTTYLPICKGILAVSALKNNNIDRAEKAAAKGLELSQRYNNVQGLVLSKYAQGEIENKHKRYATAIPYFDDALSLAQKYGLHQQILSASAGKLSSLVQLGEYEAGIPIGETVMDLSDKLNIKDIQYSTSKNLALCYHHSGSPAKAYELMRQSEELYREKNNKKNEEIIQELLIQYETEKKQKLLLQQEYQLQKSKNLLTFGGLFIILGIIAFSLYRNNVIKSKKLLSQQQEKDILIALTQGEEQERKRLANELHDGIASDLIALKLQLEASSIPSDKHIETIQNIHKEVRAVAHNLAPIDFAQTSINTAIQDFVQRMHSPTCQVDYYDNPQPIHLPTNHAMIIYRLTQEAIQNAIKHANATLIAVQLLLIDKTLMLSIEDDGIGFDLHSRQGQNLYKKFNQQIQKIGGSITIDTQTGRGTIIQIQLQQP